MDSAVLVISLLTIFQSFLDDGRMIIRTLLLWTAVYLASGETRTSHSMSAYYETKNSKLLTDRWLEALESSKVKEKNRWAGNSYMRCRNTRELFPSRFVSQYPSIISSLIRQNYFLLFKNRFFENLFWKPWPYEAIVNIHFIPRTVPHR